MKTNRTSAGAMLHPYQKKDFIWSPSEESIPNLGPILTDEEFEELIDEWRVKRTFYLNEKICKAFKLKYDKRKSKITVDKDKFIKNPVVKDNWDNKHKERWQQMTQQTITLVNNGTSWWTAETLWIKMK